MVLEFLVAMKENECLFLGFKTVFSLVCKLIRYGDL